MKSNKIAIGLIFIVTLVTLYEMVVLGKIPIASDTVQNTPISKWAHSETDVNSEYPLWFPNLFSGMPSYGSYVFTTGNPGSIILDFLIFNRGFKYFIHMALGGVFFYYFLFGVGLGRFPSLLGAFTYSLYPYFFGLINAGHSSKIMAMGYVPLLFMLGYNIINKSQIKWVLYLIIASSFQLWTNHPQVVYYTWMLMGIYIIWHLIFNLKDKTSSWVSVGKPMVMIVLGIVLSSIMVSDPYASVFEFQKHSNRGASSVLDDSGETKSGTKWDYATQWSFHPKETVSFLYPYWHGLQNFPEQSLKSAAYWGYMPFTQSTHYMGLLVVLLAILGAILKKPDKLDLFFWIATLLILITGFGKFFPVVFGPLFKLAPFFSKFRIPSMIYLLLPVTVGYLGAKGLSNLLEILKEEKNEVKFKFVLYVFGGFVGLTLLLLLFRDSLVSFVGAQDTSRFNAQILAQVKNVRKELFDKGLFIALGVSGLSLAVIWAGFKKNIKPAVVGIALIGITVVELFVINQEFLILKPKQSMDDQFIANDVDKFLMNDETEFRIFPIDQFDSNRYGYFDIASIGGYRPVKLRNYQDLMDAGGLNNFSVLNLLNVKYLITQRPLQHPDLALVHSGSQNVYQNRSVLPKAWFINSITNVQDQKSSLSTILSPEFDPENSAVVYKYSGKKEFDNEGATLDLVKYESNSIVLNSNNRNDGFLVLSEIYYKPGWKAFINDQETEIYQTDHVLRGVNVPAGQHKITFQYDSGLWNLTRIISRSLFILVLIGIVFLNRTEILALVKK